MTDTNYYSQPSTPILHHVCGDWTYLHIAAVCDGRTDCADESDELNCHTICSQQNIDCIHDCKYPHCTCSVLYFQCLHGGCVPFDALCNGVLNCLDQSDELYCSGNVSMISNNGSYNNGRHHNEVDVTHDYFICDSGESHNKARDNLCQYDLDQDGRLMYCSDGKHLHDGCYAFGCSYGYKCKSSYCIPIRRVCDGYRDCTFGDDEQHCDKLSCSKMLQCSGSHVCIPEWEVCDGQVHCNTGDDEKYCEKCPSGCECLGSAVWCPSGSSGTLAARSERQMSALILENSLNVTALWAAVNMVLNKYSVRKIGLHNVSLDKIKLNGGCTKYIFHLNCSDNALTDIGSGSLSIPSIVQLDLSSNYLSVLSNKAFSQLQLLQFLELSHNHLYILNDSSFVGLTSLRFLYLTSNPLKYVSGFVFDNLNQVEQIRSDWYMICCIIPKVLDCQPRASIFSSCTDLLESKLHQIFVVVLVTLSIMPNAIIICSHRLRHEVDKTIFTHLSIADFTMGLYLGIIASVDISFRDRFNVIIMNWLKHPACFTASMMSFISSEMSLFILAMISFVRAYNLQLLRGYSSLQKIMNISVFLLWFVIFLVGLVFILVHLLNNDFSLIENNMCLIFGIVTDANEKTNLIWMYVLFVVLNLTLCIMIVVSNVYIVVLSKMLQRTLNSLESHNTGGKMHLTKLVSFLLLLVGTNLACWLPYLTLIMMSITGEHLPEVTHNWTAIFITMHPSEQLMTLCWKLET